jgi:molecular chaperone DnaK
VNLVGIDLGTTNSVIAIYEGGEVTVIPNSEGYKTTPSIIAFLDNGESIVGELAKRQSLTNTDRTITSVKRKIGTEYEYHIDNATYTPEYISSLIIKKLKIDAENFLGSPVTEAVITVPAYFDDSQRNTTKEAGALAGLKVLRIINEPTAAALAYGYQKNDSKLSRLLVYDLGGGTFDVSVLEIDKGLIEVKATSGINNLGGDDWDAELANYLISQIQIFFNGECTLDNSQLQRVREAAEKAKIDLSTINETTVNLPYFSVINGKPFHYEERITRDFFQHITKKLLTKTKDPIFATLGDLKLTFDDIDDIILVGGSTRMPAVEAFIFEISNGKMVRKGVNPDEIVAIGAALQGGILSGDINDMLLLDVTPLSLGISTKGGLMSKIIDRNTTIPISKSQVFSTAEDNQSIVAIEVYQGEREFVIDNIKLANFELTEIPIAPRGVPQINVTFNIDVNGIVSVKAEDLVSGKENAVLLNNAKKVTKDQVDKNISDAETYRKQDTENKKIIYITEFINNLIKTGENYIKNSVLDQYPEYKTKITYFLELFKERSNTDDLNELSKDIEDFKNLLYEIALFLNINK